MKGKANFILIKKITCIIMCLFSCVFVSLLCVALNQKNNHETENQKNIVGNAVTMLAKNKYDIAIIRTCMLELVG